MEKLNNDEADLSTLEWNLILGVVTTPRFRAVLEILRDKKRPVPFVELRKSVPTAEYGDRESINRILRKNKLPFFS